MNQIPFIDLSRTTSRLTSVLSAWAHCLAHQKFVGGELVADFENKLAAVLGVQNVVACANGTDAIILALQAAELPRGARVALPNLTFWATFEAVVHAGFEPVLIDISERDLQMDYEALVEAIDAHGIKAVLLVHLFGWASADLERFRSLPLTHGIKVIEDGAQAFGVGLIHSGREETSIFADAGLATLSFYPAKVLGGCMDGGAVVVRDSETADRLRNLRDHGRAGHYLHSSIGWNSRMAGLQAAYLTEMLGVMPLLLEERRAIFSAYEGHLQNLTDEVNVKKPPATQRGNGYLNVLTLHRRAPEKIQKALRACGVETGRVYPVTIDQQPPALHACRAGDLSRSKNFCAKVLNLPLFPGMTSSEVERVCSSLRGVLHEG